MRAMVLAAGFGSRLRPITDTVPKPLVDVLGHPMIAYPFALLRQAGIREVVINTHHLGEQIRETLGDGRRFGLELHYLAEDPILDTGGAIANARAFLDGQPFVLLNADSVTEIDLLEVIACHRQRRALATLVLRPDAEAERYGTLEIDDEQRIRRILGEPRSLALEMAARLRALMFAGIHVMEPRVFDYLKPGIYSITRNSYPEMLAAGEPLYGYVHEGFWRVLDTHDGLAAGRNDPHLARMAAALAAAEPSRPSTCR